jgi:hypothetical protein
MARWNLAFGVSTERLEGGRWPHQQRNATVAPVWSPAKLASARGATVVLIGTEKMPLGMVAIRDTVRGEAKAGLASITMPPKLLTARAAGRVVGPPQISECAL